MKKAVALSLALMLLLSVPALAEQELQSGSFSYTLSEGQATITGYSGDDSSVTVPEQLDGHPVVAIGAGAFEMCEGLSQVTLPNGLTSIGDGAFTNCTSLNTVELPNGLESIGDSAFSFSGLVCVDIPDGVTSLGSKAFQLCRKLESVELPDGLQSIGAYAFDHTNIASIDIPSGVTSIGEAAFFGCTNLSEVVLPDGLEGIANKLFYDCCKLLSMDIPGSAAYIGYSAFSHCTGLKEVFIPDSVAFIADDAFTACYELCLRGWPGGYAQSFAQKWGKAFSLPQAAPEKICSEYLRGDADVSRVILVLNECEDTKAGYDEIIKTLGQNGKLDEFNQYCAVLSACRDAAKQSDALIPYMLEHRLEVGGVSQYDSAPALFEQGLSEELLDAIYRPGQPRDAICTAPVLWTDRALNEYAGKPGAFVPKDPQKDRFILFVDASFVIWIEGTASTEFDEIKPFAERILKSIDACSNGSLQLIKDPNQASICICLRISYPSAGTYRGSGREVKAYNCDVDVWACDLVNGETTAWATFKNHYGYEISVSSKMGSVLHAGLPAISDSEMRAFVDQVLTG